MSADEIKRETKDHMHKSVEATVRDLATLRTGKASPQLLEGIKVEYYGSSVPLNQVASVSAPEPRLLVIQPFDKTAIGEIEKAVRKSELGFNPSNDGNVVRIPIPQLTEDRRKELVKVARGMVEQGRVAIRNVRHHSNDKLKVFQKDGGLNEDQHKDEQKNVQDLTDKYIGELDEILKRKESDMMEV